MDRSSDLNVLMHADGLVTEVDGRELGAWWCDTSTVIFQFTPVGDGEPLFAETKFDKLHKVIAVWAKDHMRAQR